MFFTGKREEAFHRLDAKWSRAAILLPAEGVDGPAVRERVKLEIEHGIHSPEKIPQKSIALSCLKDEKSAHAARTLKVKTDNSLVVRDPALGVAGFCRVAWASVSLAVYQEKISFDSPKLMRKLTNGSMMQRAERIYVSVPIGCLSHSR